MKPIVTYLSMCYMLFAVCSFVTADTIPPLPIDELKKIELKYTDTLLKPFPVDTFYLQVYGGNILGGNLNLEHPIKKNTLVSLRATADKNYDYADYLLFGGAMDFGWLTKHFWHQIGLSGMRKNKESRYYENSEINYNPIWFISNGTLQLNNRLRGARYTNMHANIFWVVNSNISFNMPSLIGVINSDAELLFQATEKIKDENKFFSKVRLNDLFIIGDNLFLQPGINYATQKNRLGISLNSGILIAGVTTFFTLNYNSAQTFYFDTLYSNVDNYAVNNNLDYQVCDWDINWSILWKDIQILGNYRYFSSYLTWQQSDSSITPEVCDTIYNEISFNIKNKWRFLNNTFSINYTPKKLNLIPGLVITDSIRADIENFDLRNSIYVYGSRNWENQKIPKFILFTLQVGYNWKYLRVFAGAENIFDNKYEILPDKLSLGRKYLAGLEIKK